MIYFVIPTDEITDLMLAEAVEDDRARLRTSVDETQAVLSVDGVPSYAYAMRRRYTYEDIQALLATSAWDDPDDDK